MKRKFPKGILSLVLALIILITPVTAFAEDLEISDPIVDQVDLANLVKKDEIADDIDGSFSPINPEYNKVMSSKQDEKFYGLRVSPVLYNANYELEKSNEFAPWRERQAAPRKYDLREHNRVTPVKNQGPNGSCWSFASFASAESVLMPEYNDFSEKNMRNTHGFDWGPDQGGTWQVASAYLTRGSGPIAERDEPYSPYDFNSPRGLRRVKDVDKIMNIPDVRGGWDTDILKQAVMEYGAAYTTINGDESYLNSRTMGSYNPGYYGYANHAVAIVGWDDNFSRYNFGITPPGDGAWLIKNSWGQNWKYMGGYYWVSYYDAFAGRSNAIFKLKDMTPNEEIWYYDDLGMTSTYGNGQSAYFSNVFGPVNSNKDVYQVGFFVPSNEAKYEIYMTKGRGQVSFNDRVKVAEGSVTYAGYVNIPIRKYNVSSGEYFAPIVKLTTPGYNYPIPVENYIAGYSSRARANRGESYISYDGARWTDMTQVKYNANVALKAMTVPGGSSPSYDKKVSSIEFNENPVNLKVGENYKINPRVLPEDAANKTLNYTINPSGIVSVQNGVLRALRKGTATVTATATDGSYKRNSFTVNVLEDVQNIEVKNIILDKEELKLKVNETSTIRASVEPSNARNKAIYWSSTNTNVATVQGGYVKAIANGECDIIAKTSNGVSKKAHVIVYDDNNDDNDKNMIKVSSSVYSKTIRQGYGQSITVNSKDYLNRNLRYVMTEIEVISPSGSSISKSAYSDYYGNAKFTLSANEISLAGEYTVNIKVSGVTYKANTDTLTFSVEDGRPSFDLEVKPMSKEIMNNQKVQLAIHATSNGRNVRCVDLDIEIVTASGAVHKNTGRTNYYGRANYYYSPDGGQEGTYTVKVTAKSSQYKDAVGTASFEVKKYRNPYHLDMSFEKDQESYKLGDRAEISINVVDQRKYGVRYLPVKIEVSGPNNFKHNLTKYTNNRGIATVYITPTEEMGEGEYTIKASASKYGYDDAEGEYKIVFGDEKPIDPVDPVDPVEPEETIYKMIETDEAQKLIEENKGNENFVIFDARTKAEYNESHIEGCIHHDYYQKDHEDFVKTLDKNKTYLLYCRTQVRSGATAEIMKKLGFKKIYWMNGGMTKWLRENRPSVFPEYDKALDLNIGAEKSAYTQGSNVVLNAKVTDLDGNGVRKANIDLALLDANGSAIDRKTVQSGNTGEFTVNFTAPARLGKYTVEAKASYNDFKNANGLASFDVAQSEKEFTSYEDRKASGQYKHLKTTDFEYEALEKHYGKNILQYYVKDANLKDHRISDLIDPNKKTVLVFGYPGCGACVEMWKAMAPLAHEKYNFIEIVTSVEEDVKSTVNFVDNVLKELNIEHFKNHIFYDADEKIWASRLGFLTTPNTVILDENGRLVNIAGALDKDGLYDLLYKTLGLNVEGDYEPEDEYNAKLDLNFDKEEINIGETVKITAKLQDLFGKNIYQDTIRYTIKYPNGSYQDGIYDRKTGYTGETNLYFTSDDSSVEGEHEVTIELISNNYKAKKVTKAFRIVKEDKKADYNLNISFGKDNFKKGDVIRMVLEVKDQNGSPVKNEIVKFTFTYPEGKSYNYDRQTDYYGKAMLTFTTNSAVPEGKFTLKASLTDRPEYTAEKSFTIGSADPDKPINKDTLSYQDRYNNGEFNHLGSGDLLGKLKNAYGTNVSNYTLTNMQGQTVRISSLMDGRRPTVIAMGYPTCGGCQASWRSLVNINKSSFNMVEAMTMGDSQSITSILNRLGLSQMLPYFHYNARSLFNLINSNYVPCLMYLDKDGNITNLSYFNSNEEVLSIVRTIGGTISK
ncbi:lectin like domain-containing protein [uncultured Fenollaria sp.]|uniref:lectin like domain-containing protein n=1 Tax=uncultured Fenollaria sp. TaxID=1686315 RepID=UPI0025D70BD8|nr:lectin like domain-containing protein [uncultured Fenollaria sp.]